LPSATSSSWRRRPGLPRSRRTTTDLFADFSRHLGELGTAKHWDEDTFLLFLNDEKDLMEMQLQMRHEGFSQETWSTDIVANQTHYQIPTHVCRVKRVLRVRDGVSVPLKRQERISTAETTEGASGEPTYRMLDDYIVLSPPPDEAVTAGLKIEGEVASDRLSAGATVPTSFPLFAETLLVLRCVGRAWAQEESEDATNPIPRAFARRLQTYEDEFASYTTTRTFGRQPGVRFAQGG
jgi:hypothetical protein